MMCRVRSCGFFAWPVVLAILCSPISLFARPVSSRSANSRCPRICRAARTAGAAVTVNESHLYEMELNRNGANFDCDPPVLDLPAVSPRPLPPQGLSGPVTERGIGEHFSAPLFSFYLRGPPGLALSPQS